MKVLIAGDYCPKDRLAQQVTVNNFAFLSEIKPLLLNVDYSIVNLECSVLYKEKLPPPPIKKNGPNLSCTSGSVDALKWAGFNMVTLANNHILDYGREGWNDTLDVLSKADMDYVGAGNNLDEASKIFYVDIKGKKLAVINCCEHEFTIASTDYPGANPLNPIAQYYKIKEAKESADYVIVIVHGGHEHFQLPSPRMKETYRFFVDAGADAVVNHHQHCFSGYEMYQDKPIIYGLGNFCFDSINNKYEGWYYGYMVEMNLDSQITFSIIPYEQCKAKPTVHLLPSDTFDQELAELNKIIADENMLSCKVNEYYSSSAKNYELVFSPLSNRYLVGAAYRRWIPTFLSAKKIMNILNYVDCESHRDRVIDMLLRMIK